MFPKVVYPKAIVELDSDGPGRGSTDASRR